MRRQVLIVAAWAVAGALAVSLASVAVSRVGNQVTGDRPAPLSASQVQEELAAETSTTSTTMTVPSPDATGTAPAGGPTAPVVLPPSPTTTTTAATSGPAPAPTGETRTYSLVGGTATLRFEPTGVTVVVANPNPGFKVEVEPEGPGVEVSFEADHHRSKVHAWWDGGPRDDVEEDAEGDDD